MTISINNREKDEKNITPRRCMPQDQRAFEKKTVELGTPLFFLKRTRKDTEGIVAGNNETYGCRWNAKETSNVCWQKVVHGSRCGFLPF